MMVSCLASFTHRTRWPNANGKEIKSGQDCMLTDCCLIVLGSCIIILGGRCPLRRRRRRAVVVDCAIANAVAATRTDSGGRVKTTASWLLPAAASTRSTARHCCCLCHVYSQRETSRSRRCTPHSSKHLSKPGPWWQQVKRHRRQTQIFQKGLQIRLSQVR
jgi:hypothetical protein